MDWLTTRPTSAEANHWLALVSLTVFAAGVVAAGVLSTRPDLPPFGRRQTGGFVRRACTVVGWICGIGLFFGIIRLLQIDPFTFGRAIWIVLSWIALIAAIAYFTWAAPADREVRAQREADRARRSGQKRTSKRS